MLYCPVSWPKEQISETILAIVAPLMKCQQQNATAPPQKYSTSAPAPPQEYARSVENYVPKPMFDIQGYSRYD
jgi:hypothetical protein